jgi:hypothetical protein
MAKATTKAVKAPAKKEKPNLFARAAARTADIAPRAPAKGTPIQLPKDLNDEGELQGISKALNEAVSTVIAAKAEESAAKNKGNAAKGVLNPWMNSRWSERFAEAGVPPASPVTVVNHKGESLTLVVADKTQQYSVSREQIELLGAVLGPECVAKLVVVVESFGFDPKVMGQPAGELPMIPDDATSDQIEALKVEIAAMPTVEQVVAELISDVLTKDKRLTDEQKEALIVQSSVKRVRAGSLPRLAEFCGADAARLESVVEILGSNVTRYLRA